jgi:hypothetical protein
MHVILQDGRVIHVPVNAYDRLRNATPAQRDTWELIAQDTGIHWEEIDEDLSVRGLVRDFAGPQYSAAVSETASKKSSPQNQSTRAPIAYKKSGDGRRSGGYRSAASGRFVSTAKKHPRASSKKKKAKD